MQSTTPEKQRKPKARHGEGGVYYSDPERRWEARFTIQNPATDLPVRKKVHATRREVEDELMAAGKLPPSLRPGERERRIQEAGEKLARERMAGKRQEYEKLGLPDGREPTLEQWVNTWLEGLKGKKGMRLGTVIRYRQALAHVLPTLGRVRLSQLTPEQVSGVLVTMTEETGVKARTANRTRDVLRNCLNRARRNPSTRRWIIDNAAELTDPLAEDDNAEAGFLEPEQVPAFLAMCDDPGNRMGVLWATALGTAKRMSELQALRWSDVDFEHRAIHIQRRLRRVAREWDLDDPKTKGSKKSIPMPDVVAARLQQLKARQAAERLAAGPSWTQDPRWADLVFTDEKGEPPMPTTVSKTFREVSGKAGFNLRFHDQRHSAATLLLWAGEPMETISELLGHSSTTFTAATYAHVTAAMKRRASQSMDRVLGAAGG